MERLTIRRDHGILMAPGYGFYIDPDDYDLVQKVLARLAAYEDTGLDPMEIETLKTGTCLGCSIPELKAHYERIEKREDADSEGRLVVLPCKVGDTVYCILEDSPVYYPETNGWYISEETVHEITTKGVILHEVEDGASVYVELFDQIGKTVFLTREEAERALEGVQGNA